MNIKNLRTPYVILLVGPPLSGKSTFIKDKITDATIISRDQIILDLGGDNYNLAFNSVNQRQVDRIFTQKLEDAVDNKENVVIDMTHMTPKRRMHNLSFFTDDYYKVAIIFPILDEAEYIRRNKIRSEKENKSIGMDIINNMISSYRPISKEEGFDKIISI